METVNGNCRKLKKAESRVVICPSQPKYMYRMVVVRNGYVESLPISRRVAEELIASGWAYGN